MNRYASLDDIMLAVCLASESAGKGGAGEGGADVTEGDILGVGRRAEISAARAVFVGLARMHTLCSYPEIARRMGRRNHPIAYEAEQVFHRAMQSESSRGIDPIIRRIVAELDPVWLDRSPHQSPRRMEARDAGSEQAA